MEVYFATTNKGKFYSISKELEIYGIKVLHVPINIPEPRSEDPLEVAKEKVIYAYEKIKKPCIANDGGFFIYSLNGFPKAFVNFVLKTIEIEGILKLMEGIDDRRCEFRGAIAYLDSTLDEPMIFASRTKGTLTNEPKGEIKEFNWSPLSLIFVPEGENKTLSEMSEEGYWKWREKRSKESHIAKFAKWFISRYRDIKNLD